MLSRSWLVACFCFCAPLAAQSAPTSEVRWYNGDPRSGIPGVANWYLSGQQFARVYDDFVVPAGGWTIVSVFSRTSMPAGGATEASWEIRAGVSEGNGGTVVASGVGAATLTQGPLLGPGIYTYLVQVDGLWATLAPGRYWLSVSPVIAGGNTFLRPTLGASAIGDPPGNNGGAFLFSSNGAAFLPVHSTGSAETSGDYSLGVLVAPPSLSRDASWQLNLSSLAQQMQSLHSLPFPGISVAEFASSAANLAGIVPARSDAEIRTGLQALVASIGDPHSEVIWPSPRPFRVLPLSLYWFDEGIYVTAAPVQYQELLGGKLVGIGNSELDDAVRRLSPLVAHDNDSWLKYVLAANRMTIADFLFGTGVIDSTAGAEVRVEFPRGDTPRARRPRRIRSMSVEAVDPAKLPMMLATAPANQPLCRQHLDRLYWATFLDGGATVYFQYNSCREDPVQPSSEFRAQLDQMLAQSSVRRVILDMRYNTGGTTTMINPWIEAIKVSRFNHPGGLYVIVGRATYSAAMEASNRLREGTAAIFVGEPTGGKPQFLLRKGEFALPFFGIRVSYSSGVQRANDPGPTLVPDMPVGVTFRDYVNGVDPALDAILSIAPPGN